MTKKGAPPAMTKTVKYAMNPVLRFSPTAWAKLLFLRDAGDTEIGGFGHRGRRRLCSWSKTWCSWPSGVRP